LNLKSKIYLKMHSEFLDMEEYFQPRSVAPKVLNKQSRTVDTEEVVTSLDTGGGLVMLRLD
jgi:hypothetical protein